MTHSHNERHIVYCRYWDQSVRLDSFEFRFVRFVFLRSRSLATYRRDRNRTGVNVQKYSQVRNNRKPLRLRKDYLRQPLWWGGLSLVVVGALCDFGALSFAPQSVIMPVGSFTLVANVMFAHFWLGEELGYSDIVGTVLIVLGATTIAVAYGALGTLREEGVLSSQKMMKLYKRWSVLGYGLCVIVMLVSFYALSRHCENLVKRDNGKRNQRKRKTSNRDKDERPLLDSAGNEDEGQERTDVSTLRRIVDAIAAYFDSYDNVKRVHPLSYAALSGTMGSFSVVYGKSIGMLLGSTADGGKNEFAEPYLYATIVCIIVSVISQTHFLALGLKCTSYS